MKMKNNEEIERKFLIDIDKLPKLKNGVYRLQGYLSTEPCVRVIVIPWGNIFRKSKAFLAIKGEGTLVRKEYEYPIPKEEGISLLGMSKHLLSKTRFFIKDKNQKITWEIDKFHGRLSGLWVAEVELESQTRKIDLPNWVVKEVTEDHKYYSMYLAEHGK